MRRAAAGIVVLGLAALLLWSRRPAVQDEPLAISVPYDVDTLDPHARDLAGGLQVSAHLFDTLVRRDAELKLQPALALRWINPDPLTWVFTLRPDVRFHDGRALTADDVVASLQRVKGDARLQMGAYARDIDSVHARDAATVEVRTLRPVAVLLNRLALVAIVPRAASSEELATHPVGSGPYRFESWTRGEELRLTANPSWWGGAAGPRTLTLRLARAAPAALDDLRDARSQLAVVSAAAGALPPGVRTIGRPGIAVRFLGMDVSSEDSPEVSVHPNPLRSTAVRRALSLAIDRRALDGVPATQLVAPPVFGFDPSVPEAAFDVAAARDLLAKAGLPDGFAATLHARALVASAAEPVRAMLAAIGVRLDVRVEDEPTFFRTVEGRPALFLSRYACDTGDASDVLDAGLHTRDTGRHLGTANAGGFSDPALDGEIDASAAVMDPVRRGRRLRAVMQRAIEELPWIPLDLEPSAYVVREGLRWQPRADGWVLAHEIVR